MKSIPTIHIPVLGSDLEMTTRPCVLTMTNEGVIQCNDIDAVDYYGEYRGNLPWIADELEAWAKANGGYWEWENPEQITFTK